MLQHPSQETAALSSLQQPHWQRDQSRIDTHLGETLVCARWCYIFCVGVSPYTSSPLTHDKYQKMPATLSSLKSGTNNGNFKFLHGEAELHGTAEIAGDLSHRKCSGLWNPLFPYCRQLQDPLTRSSHFAFMNFFLPITSIARIFWNIIRTLTNFGLAKFMVSVCLPIHYIILYFMWGFLPFFSWIPGKE